jgi:hypothetical protein
MSMPVSLLKENGVLTQEVTQPNLILDPNLIPPIIVKMIETVELSTTPKVNFDPELNIGWTCFGKYCLKCGPPMDCNLVRSIQTHYYRAPHSLEHWIENYGQICQLIKMFLDQHEPEFNIIPGPNDIKRYLNTEIEPKKKWACCLCVRHYDTISNCWKHLKLEHLAKFMIQGNQFLFPTMVNTTICGWTITTERLEELRQVIMGPQPLPPLLAGVALPPVVDDEALLEIEEIEMIDTTVIELPKAGPEVGAIQSILPASDTTDARLFPPLEDHDALSYLSLLMEYLPYFLTEETLFHRAWQVTNNPNQ